MNTNATNNLPPVGATPEQLAENGLEWVVCGGLQIGLRTRPRVWRLLPKIEPHDAAQRTRELQRLANAARLIHDLHAAMQRYELAVDESPTGEHRALMARAEQWLRPTEARGGRTNRGDAEPREDE